MLQKLKRSRENELILSGSMGARTPPIRASILIFDNLKHKNQWNSLNRLITVLSAVGLHLSVLVTKIVVW